MKVITNNLTAQLKSARFLQWGRLIFVTGSAQVLIQAVGFLSGIMIIRMLPTEEYAYYTLANTMLGTMAVLSDSGIGTGVMSKGGEAWKDPTRFGQVIATGLDLRRKFAIGSLLVAMPILFYLLQHHGASLGVTIFIILSIIPAFFTALSGSILEIAPKLKQDILPLQKIQVSSNIARLALLLSSIFIFPFAAVAVLAGGIPQIWANLKLRKLSGSYADYKQKPSVEIRKNILVFVKRTLPMVIYYCISGQLMIWLISIFGSTTGIAQVGALARLSMLLTLITVLCGTLIVPRFARLENEPKMLFTRFSQILGGLIGLGIGIVAGVWLLSPYILMLLGPQYMNLEVELVLSITASCIGLVAAQSSNLTVSRGWIFNPYVSIFLNLAITIFALLFMDLSTLVGLFTLNICIASIQFIINISFGLYKLKTNKKAE